jgi:hypothetical protein
LDVLGHVKTQTYTGSGYSYIDTELSAGVIAIGFIDTSLSNDNYIRIGTADISLSSGNGSIGQGINLSSGQVSLVGSNNYTISVGGDPLNTYNRGLEVFSPATDSIPAFSVIANSQTTPHAVFKVLSNGNVGIGTASPAQKLHVVGSVRIDSTLILNSEYETSTDSTFTVPVNVSSVNSDKGSNWVSGTITLPANPVNGQLVSLSGQYTTVTVVGQGGATVSYQPGSAQIHHGMKYRYWASDNSWRPW